jgi:transcriptional regulator NrdR family protein
MTDRVEKRERVREPVKDPHRETDKAKPKESDFSEIMQKSKLPMQPQQAATMPSRAATEYAIKEATKEQERRGDDDKKDDRNKDKGRDSKKEGGQNEGRVSDQRVVAKGTLKQNSGQSGGQGKGRGFGMAAGRKSLSDALKKSGVKSVPLDLKGRFAKKLSESMKAAGSDRAQMSQEVINRIIQYVKVGINTKGEKEIQMELHERIFRGLKLRVISKEGKVEVRFASSDQKGREILEKNKDGLEKALSEKGIEVDEIIIT